jgi:hypothetical protein
MRFALILLTALIVSSPRTHGAETSGTKGNADVSHSCSSTVVVQQSSPPQRQAPQQQPQPWYHNWHRWIVWFWPPIWSNWALVAAAVWAGCIALGTLQKIEEQTEATKGATEATRDAAKAALLNAQATINADRAWVMVDIEWQVGSHIFRTEGTEGNSTGIFVNFICRNEGKSFAQITEKGYVFKIVQTLPQEPDFTKIDIFHHASEYVRPDSATDPYQLSGIMCNGHLNSSNMMVLYGRAKYRDVYGEHETRFGYLITGMGDLDRFPVSSYPEYNKHT